MTNRYSADISVSFLPERFSTLEACLQPECLEAGKKRDHSKRGVNEKALHAVKNTLFRQENRHEAFTRISAIKPVHVAFVAIILYHKWDQFIAAAYGKKRREERIGLCVIPLASIYETGINFLLQ